MFDSEELEVLKFTAPEMSSELECRLSVDSAALTTAEKGIGGISTPGGPTETPRSEMTPVSIS